MRDTPSVRLVLSSVLAAGCFLVVAGLAAGESVSQPAKKAVPRPCPLLTLKARQEYPLPRGVAFSPDGKQLAVARYGYVELWDLSTGDHLRDLRCPGCDGGRHLSYSADGRVLVTASTNWLKAGRPIEISAWDPAAGTRLLTRHADAMSLALSPDGKLLAVSDYRDKLRLWSLATGVQLWVRDQEHTSPLRFGPDGRLLAVADLWGQDGWIAVYDVATGKKLTVIDRFRSGCYEFRLLPDGKRIASYHEDGQIRVADLETGRPLSAAATVAFPKDGHYSWRTVSPDGRWLAATDGRFTFYLWDLASGKRVRAWHRRTEEELSGGGPCLAWSADSRRLATVLADTDVEVWDVEALAK